MSKTPLGIDGVVGTDASQVCGPTLTTCKRTGGCARITELCRSRLVAVHSDVYTSASVRVCSRRGA